MKRASRAAAAFLLLLFAAALATASGTEESGKAAAATPVTTDPATGRKMMGNMYVEGLPIVKETVTFNSFVALHGLNGDIPSMEITKRLDSMTNVLIRGEFLYPSGREEKKNLLLASGDLPELFLGSAAISASDLVIYGPQGLFLPLADLIDKWAPNVTKLYEKRPEYKKAVIAPDGKMYSIPSINELLYRESPDVYFINKTWLKKLALSAPTTTDELYNVLLAFKNSDPNGNGQRDEIPLTFIFKDLDKGLWSFFGAFGVLDNPRYHVNVDNDKVIFAPTQPEYRDAVQYLRRLYAAGLLDPEGFTQNLQQYNAKGRAKTIVLGSFLDWLDENTAGLPRAVDDYEAVPPLKGPKGHRQWNRYDGEFILGLGAFVITKANKHPEVAMRWVNELYEERLALEIARGPFGVTLKERADGFVEFIPNPKGMGYGEFRFKNCPGDAYPGVVLQDTYAKMGLPTGQRRKLDVHYPMYKPFFPKQVFPKVLLSAEQEKRMSVLRTDIHTYVERMVARWIVGEEELSDASWKAFQDQLQKMGLADLVTIYQQVYDRHRGAK